MAIAAAASTAALSLRLPAQASGRGQPTAVSGIDSDTAAAHGPAFITIRASDGDREDARNAPALQRRISLTLIGIPLGMAVQAIADRAGLETTFSPNAIPLGARVSMKADDVTVAAALRWVLADAHLDVLVRDNGQLSLVPQSGQAAARDSSGVPAGELVDGETGEPVPFGTVTVLETGVARFTDRAGHFRVARLPAGRYVVRARQIGYAPIDSSIAVARDSITRLTIRMHHVPAMLQVVRVTGHHTKDCTVTGIPDSTVDPPLAAVFAQIRENVDRYDLLLKDYPFRYQREGRERLRRPRSDSLEYVDTLAYDSRERRPYRVGRIIYRDTLAQQDSVFRDSFGFLCLDHPQLEQRLPGCPFGVPRVFIGMRAEATARRLMDLPTFADLVDSTFLAAHCFDYGGTAGNDSTRLIRVNFQPAKRIKTPDVSGSVYLDADSLVLRRAVFAISKPEAADPPILGFTVTTTFREILPLVPIVDSVESVQPGGRAGTAVGSQRLIGFRFEGRTPGEQAPTPAPDTTIVAAAPPLRVVTGQAGPVVDPAVTRVRAVFPADTSCRPTPAVDTISVIVYGTLHSRRPREVSDSTWSSYTSDVLNAFSAAFVLPDTLSLSTFSWPFHHAVVREGRVPVRAISDLSAGEEQTLVLVPPPIDSSKRRSATLAIQVRDDADDPVPFATLRLDGTTEAALTDSMGISTVHRLYPGSYLLQVRRIGYEPRDTIIVVAAGPVATTDTIQVERVAARLAVVNVQGRNGGAFVTPMIATAVTLTLGTDGSLRHVALSGSSTSDTVDSLVLAAARRAGSAHTFPVLHDVRDHPDTVPAHLAISMAEPAAGEQAVALGRLDAPAWPSVGAAHLAKMPSLPADILSDFAMGGDTASLEFVVNERGKALPATVRLDYSSAGPLPSDKGKRADRERFVRRVAGLLHDFRFDAGRVAACRVPEFIRQPFGYTLRAVSRP